MISSSQTLTTTETENVIVGKSILDRAGSELHWISDATIARIVSTNEILGKHNINGHFIVTVSLQRWYSNGKNLLVESTTVRDIRTESEKDEFLVNIIGKQYLMDLAQAKLAYFAVVE